MLYNHKKIGYAIEKILQNIFIFFRIFSSARPIFLNYTSKSFIEMVS